MKNMNMLVAILLFLIVLAVIFSVVVYQNLESRNLFLAFGAIVGAVLIFLTTMHFELKDDKKKHIINTELSIFHDRPEVAQHFYPLSSRGRISVDLKASKWLAQKSPQLFRENQQKIMRDLIMYSLVGFLVTEEVDWEKTSKSFSKTYSTQFRTNPDHKGKDTFISKEELTQQLKNNGNLFSDVSFDSISKGIFLPPSSTMAINSNTLTIDNPFCTIIFEFEDSRGVYYIVPGSNIAHAELLEDGHHKHETRYYNINIEVTYKGQRAKNKLMPAYQAWVENFAVNTKNWFSLS